MLEHFPDKQYTNVDGLAAVRNIAEIEAQGWSLNPGRHVGRATAEPMGDIAVKLEQIAESYALLSAEAAVLDERVREIMSAFAEGTST